ncbi:hypothetical protein NBRC110019_06990 [Neptunitalea chrysea]|uniref:Uncharacterized protein n=1 Tax=Neptunitalea chrysea TaxID=1647581 RepID=A0A9W6B4U7_9FLAO|nr:hypothetical protein [Neptunitalea chrysea]GLB51660.1 hypothetical protein NBRC110019_06990 [Neptunitalea chrysea]
MKIIAIKKSKVLVDYNPVSGWEEKILADTDYTGVSIMEDNDFFYVNLQSPANMLNRVKFLREESKYTETSVEYARLVALHKVSAPTSYSVLDTITYNNIISKYNTFDENYTEFLAITESAGKASYSTNTNFDSGAYFFAAKLFIALKNKYGFMDNDNVFQVIKDTNSDILIKLTFGSSTDFYNLTKYPG